MINFKALRRKSNALLLTVCMTTGLFTGLPAMAADENPESAVTGLSVTDNIDWDDDGNPLGAHANADYYKDITISLSGATLSIKYSEADQSDEILTAEDISVYQTDGVTEAAPEEIYMESFESEPEDDDREPESLVQFYCRKTGDYLLKRSAQDTDSIRLHVELPSIGFYTAAEPSDSTYLPSDNDDSSFSGSTCYLHLRARSETQSVALADYPENGDEDSIYPFVVYDEDFNSYTTPEELSDYFSYEAVAGTNSTYKITFNPNVNGMNFSLEANAKITDSADNSSWNEGCWLDISAENATEKLISYSAVNFDENGTPSLIDGAEWDSCVYVPMLNESYASIKYMKDSVGTTLSAQDITIYDSDGNPTDKVTAVDDQNGILRFSATYPGTYRISYHPESEVQLNLRLIALYPDAGFYTTDDFSMENILLSDDTESTPFCFTYGNSRSFYCNIREDLAVTDSITYSYRLYTKDETTGEQTDLSMDLISLKQNTYLEDYTSYRISISPEVNKKCYLEINYTVLDEDASHDMSATIALIPDPNYTPEPSETPSADPSVESASPLPSKETSSSMPSLQPSATPVPKGSAQPDGSTQPEGSAAPVVSSGPVNTPAISSGPSSSNKPLATPGVPTSSAAPTVTKEPQSTSIPAKQTATSKKQTIKGLIYKLSVSRSGKATAVCVGTTKQKRNTLTAITIPASVKSGSKNYRVTSIGKNAFQNCKKLKHAVIGKNVTQIGAGAFKGCKKLAKITFRATKLKKIGSKAFASTSKKLTVTAPKKKQNAYIKLVKKSR